MNQAVSSMSPALAEYSNDASRVLDAPPRFLELLPIAIYACDADGRIRWFNRRAATLWGRTPRIGDDEERFCGSYKLYYLSGQPMRHAETPMAHVLKTGTPVDGKEVAIERPDGSRATAMVHIDPIHDVDGHLLGAVNCFHDITEVKRAEAKLRESERRFRGLLEALPAAIYTTDAAGRITFYNEAAAELWGHRPELGESEWCGSWRLYSPDGRPMPHDECPMAVALKENRSVRGEEAIAERPDGARVPFIPYPTPLRDATGMLVGAVNMLVDITDRKRAEERQKALLDELNHRVKNTLATVQSIAGQTIRGADVPKDVREAFERRLLALSRTHDHLTRAGWESADLESILHDIFAPYQGDAGRNEIGGRIRLEGEPVRLKPKPALTLAMVLHELATNAAKYGSLSAPDGVLTVSWAVTDGEAGRGLRIEWQESGGPAVRQPQRRGFGSRLLERGITKELKGSAQISFDPAGVRCFMWIPV
jgi:PAS domain S-box-containing protein